MYESEFEKERREEEMIMFQQKMDERTEINQTNDSIDCEKIDCKRELELHDKHRRRLKYIQSRKWEWQGVGVGVN